jgi:multiple sugar transport system ATP-binding protein
MQLDTPMHLYSKPANKFVAGFIGSPAMNFVSGTLRKTGNTFFIEPAAGCMISLGNCIPAGIQYKMGEEIEIGIRPENIIVAEQQNTKPEQCKLEVMAFENMGNEQLIYLSLSNQKLIARRSSQEIVEMGSKIFIQFRHNEIVYLDQSTGMIM